MTLIGEFSINGIHSSHFFSSEIADILLPLLFLGFLRTSFVAIKNNDLENMNCKYAQPSMLI
jgi:hypothetical protein